MLEPIRRTLHERVHVMPVKQVEVVSSKLGDNASVIGAGCWAAKEAFNYASLYKKDTPCRNLIYSAPSNPNIQQMNLAAIQPSFSVFCLVGIKLLMRTKNDQVFGLLGGEPHEAALSQSCIPRADNGLGSICHP